MNPAKLKTLEEVNFIILAGGESKRMGKDKKFVRFGNKTFLEITFEKAKALVGERNVIISVSSGEGEKVKEFLESRGFKDFKVAEDEIAYKGPLFACKYACRELKQSYAAILAVDCIFADMRFYKLAYNLLKSKNADAAVLKLEEANPSSGVYKSKALKAACERAIGQRKDKLRDILDFLKCIFIDEKELEKENINKDGFVSINTKEVLLKYEKARSQGN